jgi:hypothetical protein
MVDAHESDTVCLAYQRTLETLVIGPAHILDRGTRNQLVITPGLAAICAADQKELWRETYIVVVQLLESYIDCAVGGYNAVGVINSVILRSGDLDVGAPCSPAIAGITLPACCPVARGSTVMWPQL